MIANWVVQLVLDMYRYGRASLSKRQVEGKKQGKQGLQDPSKDFKGLMRKAAGNSLKGGASLVLASIGAGVGTVLIKPSIGTWIGKSICTSSFFLEVQNVTVDCFYCCGTQFLTLHLPNLQAVQQEILLDRIW